jgi:hypothetical protein
MNEYRLLSQLPTKMQRFLSPKLSASEALVVAWQPDSTEYQRNQGAIRALGLFLCVLSVGLYLASGSTPSTPIDLLKTSGEFTRTVVCVAFLLAGLYLSCISILSKSWARRTLYAFTNQRAILVGARGFSAGCTFEAFARDDLLKAKVLRRPDGRIDIVLRVHKFKDEDGDPASEDVGFFNIGNADLAFGQLERLRRGCA